MSRRKALVAYVPVPHAGYLALFRKHQDSTLYVLGADFLSEFKHLERNLSAVSPVEVVSMIKSLNIFADVQTLTKEMLPTLRECASVVFPDEEVSRVVAERHLPGMSVTFDDGWHLRWDRMAISANRHPEQETVVSYDEFDRKLMGHACAVGQKSPDWWRQIGALLVRDGVVLLVAFNSHLPSEQSAYVFGDPRSNFKPGEMIDASLAAHGEGSICAVAARRGLVTEGCDMYVTDFPCPPCAAYVALAGIKRLFYLKGYSLVSGAESLVSCGVEIIRVEMNTPPTSR